MCGEKGAHIYHIYSHLGSPPRVRGKAKNWRTFSISFRITPACAGKRTHIPNRVFNSKDHPRVCGEKIVRAGVRSPGRGSPPRVRGKGCKAVAVLTLTRITPACAGKRLKKAHKIKDFDPVPIRFHLVFRRFERWCSNLPTPDGNVPV